MKSTASSTRAVIASMKIEWLLLLTGASAGGQAGDEVLAADLPAAKGPSTHAGIRSCPAACT